MKTTARPILRIFSPPNHADICDLFSCLGGLTSCSFIYDDKLLSKVTRPETFGLTIPNCPATQRHEARIFVRTFLSILSTVGFVATLGGV